MKRFIARYLDPASRLGEILFGLIMVLTVMLTAGLGTLIFVTTVISKSTKLTT